MAKGVYIGIADKARKITKVYVGVNGVARKIKSGYIGVNGVSRKCYSSGICELDAAYQEGVNEV